MMVVSGGIAIAGFVLSLVSAVATSSWCFYFCSRNENYTIEQLKKSQRDLVEKLKDLKKLDDEGAVATSTKQPYTLIAEAEGYLEELSKSIPDLERSINARCMCKLMRNVCVQNRARNSMEAEIVKLGGLVVEVDEMSKKPVKGYKLLDERASIVGNERRIAREEIWKAVSTKEEVGTICIHGTLGVGKTAIAISIHNQALQDEHNELFDNVIWVSVEYRDGLQQVQDKIAERLGIDLSKKLNTTLDSAVQISRNDTEERALRLKNALMKRKNLLLVLDSMGQPLSLQHIGIPKPESGSKLIVTCRKRTVCKKIGMIKYIEIHPLANVSEAWILFKLKFGSLPVGLKDETREMTQSYVAELDGLPLAINKLADTLYNIEEEGPNALNRAWIKELADLDENPIYLESRDPELLQRFTESYENLKPKTRLCFLYCAAFPKNHPIDSKELIEYWMWEGLLGEVTTLEKGMDEGRETLMELRNAHLLQSGIRQGGADKVRMFNLFRSMATNIMVKDETQQVRFIEPAGGHTSLTPSVYANWNRNVGRLSTLSLQDNPRLDSNSHDEGFFSIMPILRILDLSRTAISTLPTSLSSLTNLHALLLRHCPNLRTLPQLSELQQLTVLDLSNTPLEEFPQGIEYMTKLRRLNLSQTRFKTFPTSVINQLLDLEELLLTHDVDNGGYAWGSIEIDEDREGAFIEELLGLNKLMVLQLHFLNTKVLDKYIKKAAKFPPTFRLSVGRVFTSGIGVGENSVAITCAHRFTLPDSTLELHLAKCSEEISVLEPETYCLSNLRVLYISDFSGLRYLLPAYILESLQQLTELRVRNCKEMVEIVKPDDNQGINSAILPLRGLTKIVFFDLPKLKNVCCEKGLNCPNLSLVEVRSCVNLKLPKIYYESSHGSSNSRPPMVIQIRGEKSWLSNFDNNDPESSDPGFRPYSISNFKLYEIVPPENYTGAATYREYRKEQQEDDSRGNMIVRSPNSGNVSTNGGENSISCGRRSIYCIARLVMLIVAQCVPISRIHIYSMMEILSREREDFIRMINQLKTERISEAMLMQYSSTFVKRGYAYLHELDKHEKYISSHTCARLPPCCCARAPSWMEEELTKLHSLINEAETIFGIAKGYYGQLVEVVITGNKRTQDIWKLVSAAEEVGTICIHGCLGVGKTTIAVSVYKQAQMGGLFDYVTWVSLEHMDDLRRVQDKIAGSLGLEVFMALEATGDSVVERAEKLKKVLIQKGKFLLVLDNMWHALSLQEIGIPELVDGKKMIVTCRISTVCIKVTSKLMFEVKPLPSVEEAWDLLKTEMGSALVEKLEVETIASIKEGLLEEWDGLPLTISKLARTLSKTTYKEPFMYPGRRDAEVVGCFDTSYKHLEQETRLCFLFCALFPKNHLIESKELIEYWMLEGMLGDITTLKEGMDKGTKILDKLKIAHLLDCVTRGGSEDKVKMLNLFRCMAIDTMGKAGHWAFIRSGCSLTRIPLNYEWPLHVEKASFMQNQITDLCMLNRPQYNRLSTLLLQDNPLDSIHDDDFFYSMPNLRVLDLSRTCISALPKSLSSLTNLHSLLLRSCPNLTSLPQLSKLQQLTVFDLSNTPLEHCQGFQKMKKLRRLNLSQTKLARFPANVVGQMIELEELLAITDGGCMWGSNDDQQWEGGYIEELMELMKLSILHLHFRNMQVFHKYINMDTNVPPQFRFCVGEVQTGGPVEGNNLTISGSDSGTSENNTSELSGMKMPSLLKLMGLNFLDVSNFSGITYLFSAEILGHLTKLTELRVTSCKEMVEVIQQPDAEGIIFLPELARMVFIDLPRLKSVCCRKVLHCPNLLTVGVWGCDNFELPMIEFGSSKIELIGDIKWDADQKSKLGLVQRSVSLESFMEATASNRIHRRRISSTSNVLWTDDVQRKSMLFGSFALSVYALQGLMMHHFQQLH